MRSLLGILPLLLAQAGCTVTAVSVQADEGPNNSCSSDSDCSNQHCSAGLCQTLKGELESLLVSVTPPSDSDIPHLTFVANVDGVPTSGGAKDLVLPGPRQVTGRLLIPVDATCYPTFINVDTKNPTLPAPDGKSLPISARLTLQQRLLGLPQQLYFATATDVVKNLNSLGAYFYQLQVPGGDYDVYLVPPSNQQRDCAVPPQLFRGISIAETSGSAIQLDLTAAPVSELSLTIHWPRPADATGSRLDGWVADLIEPLGGNPISTEFTLGAPQDPNPNSDTVDYVVPLRYSPVTDASADPKAQPATDLLRLRPPEGVIGPTIFLDRSGLGLFDQSTPQDQSLRLQSADLTGFKHFPAPVHVQGLVTRLDDGTPISGFLTVISTSITGVDDGIFASFQTTLQVKDDGVIDLELPPGNYRVQAIPPMASGAPPVDGALAALETTWMIPAQPTADVGVQAGKLLELPPISELTGQARVKGVQVQALPTPQTVPPFEQAFGGGAFAPRATAAIADDSGHFVMQADPGQFELSVQAPESLGFGWFVRPGVQVALENQDLGRVTLPLPSLLSGSATLATDPAPVPLASAVIRAYAYLDDQLAYTRDPKLAASVVQVAQTRADEAGAFRLLLPASIAVAK